MKSDIDKWIFIINKTLTLLEFLNFTSFDKEICFFLNFGKGNSYNSPSGISVQSLQLRPISALRCYVTIFEEKKTPWNLTWCCFIKIWRTCLWNIKVNKNFKTCCFMHYTVYSEFFFSCVLKFAKQEKMCVNFYFRHFLRFKKFLPNIMFVNWIFCDVKHK